MKKVIILTSNSCRHIYFANVMCRFFDVVGVISEPKSNYFDAQRNSSHFINEHFKRLKFYEEQYLGEFKDFPEYPLLNIDKANINSLGTLQWAENKKADLVFLYGTGILSNAWLDMYENKIINLHLGYSPRYRGSATLFWPFVNDDLNHLGATIHLASSQVDAGDIIKIITPDIQEGDNYYDLNFKTIKKSIDSLPRVVLDFLNGLITPVPQNIKEQIYYYRKIDFNEEALKKVLHVYGP